jgi:hypothetical protein
MFHLVIDLTPLDEIIIIILYFNVLQIVHPIIGQWI